MEQSEKQTRFIDWRKSDKGDSVAWALVLIWGAFIILGGSGQLHSW